MPRIAAELAPTRVKALTRKPGVYAVGVVGLYLQVTASTATPPGPPVASWIMRRTLKSGERIKVGLGRYAEVPLAVAREQARALAEGIALGGDPHAERRAERSAAQAAKLSALTFDEAARECIESLSAGWKNAKHAAQWTATLEQYASPVLGAMLVEDIDMQHVLKALTPIWTTKAETASRVRMRMEKVIAFADARAKRERPNPARWKNNLDTQLAKPTSVKKARKQPALPIDDMPAFMTELRAMDGSGARALELAILCASRSGEVRGATWDEFDLDAGMWVIPAERMKIKSKGDHRVPLSAGAVRLLRALPRVAEGQPGANLVFPSAHGKPLSDMTLSACIKRMNEGHEKPRWIDPAQRGVPVVPHGMRSTFTDWAGDRMHYPKELRDLALAHAVGDKVEAAYRRGDMVDKRREMMDAWAKYCATPRPTGSNVVPMPKAAR